MVADARRRRLNRIARQGRVSELIGRYVVADAQMSLYRSRSYIKTVDETIPDYEFWDRLRRGKAFGYTLGGLFARRIESIFAGWTLGRGVTVELAEKSESDNPDDPRNYTNGLLADFISKNLTLLLTTEMDKLGLGDQYIVVNADGSLSVASPDTVTIKRDPFDYRTVVSITITTKLDGVTIVDEYRADGRTVTIKRGEDVASVQEFQNLIGRIPVIHLANGMTGNEVYGHSIHEELKALYDQYDDLIYKQLDGAKLLGNPLLAFVGMEDISAVRNANQPASNDTYIDKDGNQAERPQLNIDTNAVLIVGKGGDAKFVAPPTGFTADTQQSLKTLFLLLLDHTGIPEFIWGNELSGSHATAEVQLTQWVRDIEARRKQDECWLLELCEIWLATTAIIDPQVVVDDLKAEWPELVDEDEKTRLLYVQYAHDAGLLTAKTALSILDLVDDPTEETKEAEAERQAKQDAMFPDGTSASFQNQLGQDAGSQPNDQVQQMDDTQYPVVHEYTFLLDAVRELRNALLEVAA